jgi:hypothetical protein
MGGDVMTNRISTLQDDFGGREERGNGPQPIGEVLEQLLTQYEVRFPSINIVVVETAATAV